MKTVFMRSPLRLAPVNSAMRAMSALFAAMLLSFAWDASAGNIVFPPDSFMVLSYHDIKDVVERDASTGQTAVSTAHLAQHFKWLRQHGYHPVSVQDLIDARDKKRHLPRKAVLITFDDGYASFYKKAFPLLKRFHYPAMVALVGRWMENTADSDRVDGEPKWNELLTWDQLKELRGSGLVEIASHSYDLHRGIPSNPQGNTQAAGVSRAYDTASKTYESDQGYQLRIQADMQHSADTIFQHTGFHPRVIVWPYGEQNQPLLKAAAVAGMGITLGLRDGLNFVTDLSNLRRLLITENPDIADFSRLMSTLRIDDRPLHVVHVDLDYVYDPNPERQELNLGKLVKRIQDMEVNTVYLQAFADPDGDGNADALYFPNRHLPVRSDLFNRAAWQLFTRTRVKVYAWMPTLAFRINAPDEWFVHEWHDGKSILATHIYKRLSPFNTDARRVVGEIYEDLAKYAHFTGILYHDDAILSDFEDVTPEALAVAGNIWGLSNDPARLRENPAMLMKWAKRKTEALNQWTDYLSEKVRYYRPGIKTARNYYALPLLMPESEEWYAQSYETAFKHYDYVAIEAMPFMEKAENPDAWLDDVVHKIAAYPDGLKKTVFELQTVDWNTQKPIPMPTFIGQLHRLQKLGAMHIGYYPDNYIDDQPNQVEMKREFAVEYYP
jgi:biofilm PGA synthesis lipoprotein PgaB